ncbi:hypothetical protein ACJMK2_023399 [Sinanodonta woodiana]|uniref:Autophagy-related protein 27 n=1 Tax=Sinanodonta woodiana TaxID=1069815 RepID=A0ABD3T4X6_SINWO
MLNWKVLTANIYIVIIICVSLVYIVQCQNPCVDKSSCKCSFKDGSVVDLSSLGNTDSTARFKDVLSPDGNLYSFNPCYGFNEESECIDASICVTTSDRGKHVLYAQPNDGSFQNDTVNKKLVLHYLNRDVGIPAIVDLICDEKAQVPIFRTNGIQLTGLSMSITSKCACINSCKMTGSVIGISAGTVLCIIFFSLLLAYLIGGMVFMRFCKNARGLEIVPNVTLWKSIPGLIKDGVMFSVCRPFLSSNYQKI